MPLITVTECGRLFMVLGDDPGGSIFMMVQQKRQLYRLPKEISEMVGQTCRFAATTCRSSPTISEISFGNHSNPRSEQVSIYIVTLDVTLPWIARYPLRRMID